MQTTKHGFVGRERELTYLDQQWLGHKTNVLVIHAEGGAGKTTLLQNWLMQPDALHFPPRRTYVWTFQEEENSDAFFADALAYFGYTGKTLKTPWEKGLKLAALLHKEAALLILEDVCFEQDPAQEGICKDAGLYILLQQLHENNPGLCIVSTDHVLSGGCSNTGLVHYSLPFLAQNEAVFFIKKHISGSVYQYEESDIEQLAVLFGKNLFLLSLISFFFKNYDVNNDFELKSNILNFNVDNTDQAFVEIMNLYEDHLLSDLEIKVIYLFSSFKEDIQRQAVSDLLSYVPAQQAGLSRFFKPKQKLASFLKTLKGVDLNTWRTALDRLLGLNLIVWDKAQAADEIILHPCVHRHYAQRFEQNHPRVWKQLHHCLYRYYRDSAEDKKPKNLHAMQPLLTAMFHAAQAGLEKQAHKEVYWERIRQRVDKNLNLRLGAPATDLQILRSFFDKPWNKAKKGLSYDQQYLLLGWVLSDLLALGRLDEAVVVLQSDLENTLSLEDWQGAGLTAGKLAEVYLSLGKIEAATELAYQSIDFAERSSDRFLQIVYYAVLGKALHYANRLTDAERMFRKAERLQQEWTSDAAWLPSVQNYMYCDLLLEKGDHHSVLQRVSATIKTSKKQHWSTGAVLDQLLLGRAYLLQSRIMREDNYAEAVEWLELAITGLHHNGQWQHLPVAWLSRAKACRYQGNIEAALKDLALTKSLATYTKMETHLLGYHLESAQLALQLQKNRDLAQQHIVQAEALMDSTGYLRHKNELEAIKAHIEKQCCTS